MTLLQKKDITGLGTTMCMQTQSLTCIYRFLIPLTTLTCVTAKILNLLIYVLVRRVPEKCTNHVCSLKTWKALSACCVSLWSTISEKFLLRHLSSLLNLKWDLKNTRLSLQGKYFKRFQLETNFQYRYDASNSMKSFCVRYIIQTSLLFILKVRKYLTLMFQRRNNHEKD